MAAFVCGGGGDMVSVYTDGACSRNGQDGAKAGVGVWFGTDDHPDNIGIPLRTLWPLGGQTNQRAELAAIHLALSIVTERDTEAAEADVDSMVIYSDSTYAINCLSTWIQGWRRRGWRNSHGRPVSNRDIIEPTAELLAALDAKLKGGVRFVHVRGHSGIRGNEAADVLARFGAKSASANLDDPGHL